MVKTISPSAGRLAIPVLIALGLGAAAGEATGEGALAGLLPPPAALAGWLDGAALVSPTADSAVAILHPPSRRVGVWRGGGGGDERYAPSALPAKYLCR